MIRLFVETPLHEGTEIFGAPGQAHYLGAVMRRGVGDAVLVFNGRDGEYRAIIAHLRKDKLTLTIGAQTRAQTPEAGPILVFAALKREAANLIAEKATELGVAALQPVFTQRSNASRVGTDRLRAIAIEAAEQCNRLSVPEIRAPLDLMHLIAQWNPAVPLLLADETGGAPIAALLQEKAAPFALLVGPEGGFSPQELDILYRHAFILRAALGPRILRAETAAIAGLALIQALAGDWRLPPRHDAAV